MLVPCVFRCHSHRRSLRLHSLVWAKISDLIHLNRSVINITLGLSRGFTRFTALSAPAQGLFMLFDPLLTACNPRRALTVSMDLHTRIFIEMYCNPALLCVPARAWTQKLGQSGVRVAQNTNSRNNNSAPVTKNINIVRYCPPTHPEHQLSGAKNLQQITDKLVASYLMNL